MSDRSIYEDPLEKFTARDLCTALHWTSADDLAEAIGEENPELWDSLIQADRNLQKFYGGQLAKVIAFNKKMIAEAEQARKSK